MKTNLVAKATFLLLALLFMEMTARAQQTDVPRIISYQGKIDGPSGQAISDGKHTITVSLYRDEAGEYKVWTSTEQVDVKGGLFNLQLGASKALPKGQSMSGPLFVGVSVNGTAEMRPLTMMTAAPYSLAIPDKSVTMEKLSDEVLTRIIDFVPNQDKQQNRDDGIWHWGETGNGDNTVTPSWRRLIAPPFVFLGTFDENDMEVHLNDQAARTFDVSGTGAPTSITIDDITRVFRFERGDGTAPNIIGGFGSGSSTGNRTISGVDGSTIAGGGKASNTNTISSDFGFIGSGFDITITSSSDNSVIGGGEDNDISDDHSIIGGGKSNSVLSSMGVVVGGEDNDINVTTATHGFVGGGKLNKVSDNNADFAVIGGGLSNIVKGLNSCIVGGESNQINDNRITHSFIGGGQSNFLSNLAAHSSILGGEENSITEKNGVIGGGWSNEIGSEDSFIGGGFNNTIEANTLSFSPTASTIAGGEANHIYENSFAGFIGGGYGNDIYAKYGVITGGRDNTIISDFCSIIGGVGLKCQSYAQTVIGRYNLPQGSSTSSSVNNTDRLFIIGNGDDSENPSNAFEVSNDGHSIVYDENGSGTYIPSVRGATYTDNVIYAWAEVIRPSVNFLINMTWPGQPLPVYLNPSTISLPIGGGLVNDFGVNSVKITRISELQWEYEITLNVGLPDYSPLELSNIGGPGSCAITVTPIYLDDDPLNLFVLPKASRMKPGNKFKVITNTKYCYPLPLPPGGGEPPYDPATFYECSTRPSSFYFIVTGRPK